MEISRRSKYSLCQLLEVLNRTDATLLLEKHGISTDDEGGGWRQQAWALTIRDNVMAASGAAIGQVLQELLRTADTLRHDVSPRYTFDERWNDFQLCLRLDGFDVETNETYPPSKLFVPVEPQIEGVQPIDDALSAEIRRSGLQDANSIIVKLDTSAVAFIQSEMNNCLTNVRIALETIARSISQHLGGDEVRSKRWGGSLRVLVEIGFLDNQQEGALVGIYTFISPGAHRPVGFTEAEYVRLGRQLALSLCYFLIKKHNGSSG